MSILIEKLKTVPALEVLCDEPMSSHTSFRIGGPADLYLRPHSEEALIQAVRLVRGSGTPLTVLGNGSNVLVRDEGIRGAVLGIGTEFGAVEIAGNTITAQAGVLLSSLSNEACKAGLSGLEFAGGIPGSLGGALFMNAGAYGGQMADVVRTTRYLDENYEVKTVSGEEHGFGYRKSIFVQHPEWIALSAEMELRPDAVEDIRARMNDFSQRRRDKQPLNLPSAGSTFKRPEGYFAGKLIQDAGLKGFTVGGAQVSEKHAGFVVNRGGATCADVLSLIEQVQERVFRQFGVMLEPEVRIL
ncbi:MAG: UDP-N-acetylmuramate dehydrogenase [Butyricicoccaceae bacterium]